MPFIKVNDKILDVDIRRELEQYTWHRAKWSSDKLIAASPFRYDQTPSFFVGLDTGGWADSGAVDPIYASGSFVKLLSFLRSETYEETVDYLQAMYATEYNETMQISLRHLRLQHRRKPLDMALLRRYMYRHPYLAKRGISEDVQRMMRVGYCRTSKAVTIPWFTADGKLGNIKFRKVGEKTFWYQRGGLPIRNLVYGMEVIYRNQITDAVIVEGEIDAMYLMTAGIPAIAIGGSNFTDVQAEAIVKSPIESLTVIGDNDSAGDRVKECIFDKLRGHVELKESSLPKEYNDVNDVREINELRRYFTKYNAKSFKKTLVNLTP
jgi:5S rRNA maturation endonuclease (ribonuclease M5)